MKKSIIIACSMLFSLILQQAPAQTNVQGPVSGYWAEDTVFVSGDIYIEDGQMLVIYHGVVVYFLGDFKLEVYGTLKSYGWPSEMVFFTTDENTTWGGIHFYKNQEYLWRTDYLKYTILQNACARGEPDAQFGGAIKCYQDVDITLYRCIFKNNCAQEGGGAVYLSGCDAVITNCAFLYNTAGSHGGAIFFDNGSDAVLTNCILWANEAPEGASVYIGDNDSDPEFTYSDIQFGKNGFAGPGTGMMYSGLYNNNISKDPICFTTAGGAYSLSICSPCIDMGKPGLLDPDGSRLDIGAVYLHHEGIYVQEPEVKGTWNAGVSPVWVNTDINIPVNETLTIEGGVEVKVLGHHRIDVAGSLQAMGEMYNRVVFTAVVASMGWDGINILPESAYSDPSQFHFCTIEYGVARGDGDFEDAGGGLMINGNSNVTVENCDIMNCQSITERGDLSGGGGLAILNCSPFIRNNKIMQNHSSGNGGGVLLVNACPQMLFNLIAENTSDATGAGIMLSHNSIPVLMNNTICYNSTPAQGGGLYCSDADPMVINTILYFNSADEGTQVFLADDASDPNFAYCDVEGGDKAFEGEGSFHYTGYYLYCIESNPLFRPSSAYYAIEYGSPCINAGHPNSRPDPDESRADIGYRFCWIQEPIRLLTAVDKPGEAATEIRMYPNPASNMVNFDLSLAEPGVVTVEVYNALGQLTGKTSDNQLSPGSYHTTLSVTDLKPGIYLVRLTAKNMMHTKTLVVE